MKKYLVRFTTTSDDYDKEWCYADSPQEAAENIKRELWGVKSIDSVQEMK